MISHFSNVFDNNNHDSDPIVNPFLSKNLNCNFYDEDSFTSSFANCEMPIVLNINIQYLLSKYENLKYLISRLGSKGIIIDIISLQEISNINDPLSISLPGFHPFIFNSRSQCKGGGIGFYVRSDLKYQILDDLSPFHERILESMSIEVEFKPNRKITFTSLYRPPGNHPSLSAGDQLDSFMKSFSDLVCLLSSRDSYICMDSNINLLNLVNSNISQNFIDLLFSNGFLNLITKATRFSKNSFSLIDQICSNLNCSSFTSGVIISDLSDHFITFSCLSLKKDLPKAPKFKDYRDFSNDNILRFKSDLSKINWGSVLTENDPNIAFSNFWDNWSMLFDLHFPLKRIHFNKNHHKINDFMSKGLLVSRKNKLNLHLNFIRSQNNEDFLRYKSYRNLYNKLLRVAKKLYFEAKLERNQGDPKKMWDTLNEAINRKCSKNSFINEINVNGQPSSDSQKIANEFNIFFSEIGEKIKADIPPTSAKPEDYLSESGFIFELGTVAPNEVIDIINSLQCKSSLDIDNLNSKLIKNVISEISSPLAHIFTLSFRHGIFPDRFKISRTCPVFKSGDKDNMSNYRPISCLPVLSKLIEKIVFQRLYSYICHNNLLFKHQYGFQPKKSTVHPLLNILNYVSDALNNNEYVVSVFLDLRKAFDVIDHDILILKLSKLGLHNNNLKWFSSYLKNRKQFVMVNNVLSEFFKVFNISVPQGSILGPLLFLIFINDIFKSNSLLNFLFADDTSGLAKGPDIHLLANFVNTELQKLGMWLRANKLCVNADKTKVMIFHHKNKNIPPLNFFFNNNDINGPQLLSFISPIERISNSSTIPAFKMLGIFLDENLSFNYHIKQVRNKVSKALYFLVKAKNVLSSKALKTLYFALVHSHLLYCLPIYCSTNKKNLDSLYTLQKKCIRTILNAKYNSHSAPLFTALNILPFPDLITQQILLIMHSIDKKYCRVNFEESFILNSNSVSHDYALRNANDYLLPHTRYESLKNFPFYSFPKIWNELEPGFRSVTCKSIFKYNIKSHLMLKYSNFSCDKLFCYICSRS